MRIIRAGLVLFSILLSLANAQDPPNTFPIDNDLKKRVDFWVKIYTEYTTSEGVIHDAAYPETVFEKMDFAVEEHEFSVTAKEREKKIQNRIKEVKEFYKKLLFSIHQKQNKHGHDPKIPSDELNPAEKRVFELYKDIEDPKKFLHAAQSKRIRMQRGLKDRFLQGLFYAGRYLPAMEKIFQDRGIPSEITRLPFVESSFNIKARSKVGASGIWQFMRSTGKLYLKINEVVDERNDPLRATEGAAQLLKQNYESLKSWALAITAYNHGRKGLMRAVQKVGSEDLSDIIASYRSRNFGFASSNFYAEFLAAVEVEKNSDKYFGKFEREKPIAYFEFIMTDYVSATDIATYTRIPLDTLMDLNPGLSPTVFRGKHYIPAGYVLRLPEEMKETFLSRYNEIPPNKKFEKQRGLILQATRR